MDDDLRFERWFSPWMAARPEFSPIGWFARADLMAAFLAGRASWYGIPGRPALDALSADLATIESWLRDQPARHSADMADVIDKAWRIIDNLSDGAED